MANAMEMHVAGKEVAKDTTESNRERNIKVRRIQV
jgi:hypothetical protein